MHKYMHRHIHKYTCIHAYAHLHNKWNALVHMHTNTHAHAHLLQNTCTSMHAPSFELRPYLVSLGIIRAHALAEGQL